MKKLFFAAALVMGVTSVSLAGTPKGEAKDATDANVKTEVKAQLANTYYVTGQTDDNQYILSDQPPMDPSTCKTNGSLPCQISSDTPLSSPIAKEEVDNNPAVQIDALRDSF